MYSDEKKTLSNEINRRAALVDYKDSYGTMQEVNKSSNNENKDDKFMKRRYSRVMVADPY